MNTPSQRAEAEFRSGATCSQAIFLTFCERFGIGRELAARIALGLGGGVGRAREICGAASAMALLAGLKLGEGTPADPAAKKRTYAAVQEMLAEFKKRRGTYLCRELLAQAVTTEEDVQSAEAAKALVEIGGSPEERTPEYYARRKICALCVRDAAEIVDSFLSKE